MKVNFKWLKKINLNNLKKGGRRAKKKRITLFIGVIAVVGLAFDLVYMNGFISQREPEIPAPDTVDNISVPLQKRFTNPNEWLYNKVSDETIESEENEE